MKYPLSSLLPWLISVVILVIDQVTKRIVVSSMDLHETIPVLGDLLRWTYIQNDGLVFGLDAVFGGRTLGIISLIATVVFVIFLIRVQNESLYLRSLMGAIIGGAIGNTIDRLAYGYVIDFIDVDMPDAIMDRFHVFNIADSALSVGVTLIMLLLIFGRKHDSAEFEDLLSDETDRSESHPDAILQTAVAEGNEPEEEDHG